MDRQTRAIEQQSARTGRDGTRPSRRSKPAFRPGILGVINTVVLAFLLGLALWLGDLASSHAHRDATLQAQLSAARVETDAAREKASERLRSIESLTRKELITASAELKKLQAQLESRQIDEAARVKAGEAMVRQVAAREEKARQSDIGAIHQRIAQLDTEFEKKMAAFADAVRRDREAFQRIQREWDHAVFLIHSRFAYTTKNDDGTVDRHYGTGWGTGFVISKFGHIVTNKHVAQPWKFDPELAAMEALGEVKILPDTLVLAAWRSGSSCMTKERTPDLTTGFNNAGLKNLEIIVAAPDSMITKTMEIGAASIDYQVHDLDNNDLVILHLKGTKFRPVVCRPFGTNPPLSKLDQVMALGFPRGQRGLEARVAESSPSVGTVRKVENTIHITASIIPGNSGGPLFNPKGEVVGIATRIYSETLGICLKIDHVLDLMKQVHIKDLQGRTKVVAADPPKPKEIMGSHK